MTKIGAPLPGSPEYNQLIDDIAARGARAIAQTSNTDKAAIFETMPGTVKDIGRSFHGRLLRRKPEELARLISVTHLDQTTETAGRVSHLREAVSNEHFGAIKVALADIAKAAEVSPGVFTKLVEKLELIAAHTKAKDLKLVPAPIRMRIEDLAQGDVANLYRQVADELAHYAYTPLRKAVDAPKG